MNAVKIVKYVFTILGALMLIGTFFIYRNTSGFLSKSIETEGTVIEMIRTRSSSSSSSSSIMYKPLIQFSDLSGSSVEFQSSTSSSSPSYSVGEKVTILYNINSPNKAKIKGFFSLWGGVVILGILGTVFFSVGASIFFYQNKKKKLNEYLKQRGTRIEADFKDVILNTSYAVNGRNPYQIISQWQNPATSKLHIFKSDNIWFDPTEYVKTEKIKVLIDKKNPKSYLVDISFLPELA